MFLCGNHEFPGATSQARIMWEEGDGGGGGREGGGKEGKKEIKGKERNWGEREGWIK